MAFLKKEHHLGGQEIQSGQITEVLRNTINIVYMCASVNIYSYMYK